MDFSLVTNSILTFPLNAAARDFPPLTLLFQIVFDKLMYLGVQVTNIFANLFIANFEPLLTETKVDLKRWWLKMFIPLQLIPVYLIKSFFCRLLG